MKKIVILIFLGLFLVSCDKIETPNQKPPAVYNCISPLTQIVKTNQEVSNQVLDSLSKYSKTSKA